jgi:hypothetical protein
MAATPFGAATMVSAWVAAMVRPALGAAGLRDHRQALRAGAGIERAAGTVIFPLIVDGVDLGGIDEHAAVAVGNDGAGLPGPPELLDDLDILLRHEIALVMLGELVHAEILRGIVGAAGHHVPAGTAAGYLIERADDARGQIRVVGEGGEGGHDAKPLGCRGHQRRHHRGLLARHANAAFEEYIARIAPVLANIDRVLDQYVIEAGALHFAHQVQKHVRHHPVFADVAGPRLTPCLDARSLKKPRKMERVRGHSIPSSR